MKNDEYWQKRAEQRLVEAEQIAKRAEEEMKKAFDAAYQDIELQIYKLYGKYATDNSMTYADALAYLTNDELEDFRRDLAFYIARAKDADYRTEFRTYLQALSTRARVRRLEAYQAQLKMIAEQLYTEQLIPRAAEAIQAVTVDSYHKAAFDVSQSLGVLVAFDQPSPRLVNQVLEYPWSGKNFSRKWWDNCDNFEAVLDVTLTKGLITGASNQRMARELRDKTGASYSRAERLVRTETNYAHNQSTAALYEDVGVERYRYLATLDLRTSPMCREMDGKIIAYADKTCGVNYPPLHPRCRSTTVPVIYEDEVGTRVARDKDGKTYKVPADMTYKEWYGQYVANDPEALKQERMLKNKSADKATYERYKEAFKGTNLVKSFDEFIDLKYNNTEGYKTLVHQYRDIRSNKAWLGAEFANRKKLERHLRDHLHQYEGYTDERYVERARELLASKTSDGILGFENDLGWRFRYDVQTNDLAIGRPGNVISTLFKPEDGMNYWQDQVQQFTDKE